MTPRRVGLAGAALEAVAFAILGYRMLRGMPGNIPDRDRRTRTRNSGQAHPAYVLTVGVAPDRQGAPAGINGCPLAVK